MSGHSQSTQSEIIIDQDVVSEGKQEMDIDIHPPPKEISATPPLLLNRRRLPSNLLPTFASNVTSLGGETVSAGMCIRPNEKRQTSVMKEEPSLKVTLREKNEILSKINRQVEDLPEFTLSGITFNTWSTKDIINEAIIQVSNPNETGHNSVNDPRLGVVDPTSLCQTCLQDVTHCPGHFGYINIEKAPVYNPLFIKEIVRVLSSVCNSCGGLLLDDEIIEHGGISKQSGGERLKLIAKDSEKMPCHRDHSHEMTPPSPETALLLGSEIEQGDVKGCEHNPKYTSGKIGEPISFFIEDKVDRDTIKIFGTRTPREVFDILDSISDEDAALMGFNPTEGSHPRNMVMTVIVVMPSAIRSANLRDGLIGSDTYSKIYRDYIIKPYQEIDKSLGVTEKERENIDKAHSKIQDAINTLITNYDSPQIYISESFKPIRFRIQDKNKGIVRGMAMGKRVNFSARTVLGPDPSLKFNQIRLPEIWREKLTREVIVTNYNRNELMSKLKNGQITHVTFSSENLRGRKVRVNDKNKQTFDLVAGDMVQRWGQDGDMVLMNRQPTIHKQGIMGHEAVFRPGLTIGLPLVVTSAYNADFDGDEGNIHAVQTLDAVLDILATMDVRKNIINAQDNRPIIGPVMDSITSAYLMTQDDVYIDNDFWYNSLMYIESTDGLPTLEERLAKHNMERTIDPSDNIKKYSGRAMFSAILPNDFFYNKGGVIIVNGIMISGTLTKSTLGNAHNSIVQVLYKNYGEVRTGEFLTDAPRLLENWLTDRGFSVGLADCNPLNPEHAKIIREEVAKVNAQVRGMGASFNDPLEEARRQNEIKAKVGQAKDIGNRISIESLRPDNSLNVMAESGAKGSKWNIGQVTGIIGQQFLQSQRMPQTLTDGRRSSVYFRPDEIDPEARGFISSSFMKGMNPAEQFFHQAAGREGLIDTANKTADVGTLHRDIVKLVEDLRVSIDGSVVTDTGRIVQEVYADDGFDGKYLQNVKHGDEDMPFFIDVNNVAGRLNAKHGFYPGNY